MDGPYAKIIRMMQQQGATNNSAEVQIGVMTAKNKLKIGDLELDKDDLLFMELLVRPQLRKKGKSKGQISINGGSFQSFETKDAEDEKQDWSDDFALKAGDVVAVTKINEDCYAVLGRLVSV